MSGAQFEAELPADGDGFTVDPGVRGDAVPRGSRESRGASHTPGGIPAAPGFASERGPAGVPQDSRESDLLRQAQDGDRGAYGQVVAIYQDRLYNAVLRLVGDADEARDVTQEAFTRGLMKLDSFRGDASPYTWLFRIAMNLAISQLRKVKRHRTFSLDSAPSNGRGGRGGSGNGRHGDDERSGSLLDRVKQDSAAPPPDALERRECCQQVVAALGRIDVEYREVLVMRDIEGFDYQQMAEVLDVPLGTLKSRLFRARLALRDELKSYMDGKKTGTKFDKKAGSEGRDPGQKPDGKK